MDSITPSEETRQLISFLRLINKAVRKHGIKKMVKTIEHLSMEDLNEKYDDIYEHIIYTVIDHFKIKREDLSNNEKRGEVTVARKIAMIQIKKHLNIADEAIAKQFNRVRQTTFGVLKDFNNLNRENKNDQKFFLHYDPIDEKIERYVQGLNQRQDG